VKVASPVLERKEWTKSSRRAGAVALKLGMTHLWDTKGNRIPVTLLQILENEVVQLRTVDKEGYYGVQIGAVNHTKPHKVCP
jgi:large subunit ribosomal protein L3